MADEYEKTSEISVSIPVYSNRNTHHVDGIIKMVKKINLIIKLIIQSNKIDDKLSQPHRQNFDFTTLQNEYRAIYSCDGVFAENAIRTIVGQEYPGQLDNAVEAVMHGRLAAMTILRYLQQ